MVSLWPFDRGVRGACQAARRRNQRCCVLATLGIVACKTDPVYLGPIEITGSVAAVHDSGPPADMHDAAVLDAQPPDPTPFDGGASDAAVAQCNVPADGGAPIALPLVVDSYFAPSGWAGDAAVGALTVPACDRDREPGAQGLCHKFEYTPIPSTIPGSASWAGVFFQYPNSNWGAVPGLLIESGALRVTFVAAGSNGGEIVTFRAGGIDDASGVLGCSDQFSRDLTVRLSTEFQRYEIDLGAVQYSRVISAFSWKVSRVLFSGETPAPISFYIDDIRWE